RVKLLGKKTLMRNPESPSKQGSCQGYFIKKKVKHHWRNVLNLGLVNRVKEKTVNHKT
ncbi:Hypothetical protein FKW44_012288, partial [Caligus rogercresseyi]